MDGPASIVPIVEGPGDRDASPVLLRRTLFERLARYDITVARPKKANGKQDLLRRLENFLRYSVMTPSCQGIIVLLDSDDECPRDEAMELAGRARAFNLTVPVAIVEAKRGYEAWIVASLGPTSGDEIRERLGLASAVAYDGDVEELSGAKAWLTRNMPSGRAYKETSDQPALSTFIDLDIARARSRSFRRLCHAVEQIVDQIDKGLTTVTP